MILRAVRVHSFGVLNPGFEVADLPDGITVFYGPNEAGKSTLLRALTYALYQRHKLGGEEVEREILPVGTALAPRVDVEFEKDGDRWRIEKSFLRKKASALSRFEGGQYVPRADGDDADEALKGILDSDYAGKGKGKEEHRGIGEVLVCDQDSLRRVHALGDRARSSLRGVLGSVTVTREAHGLADAVGRQWQGLFTSKGELRENSKASITLGELRALETRLAQLRKDRAEVLSLEVSLQESTGMDADAEERKKQLGDALRDAEADARKRIALVEREASVVHNHKETTLRLSQAEEREAARRKAAEDLVGLAEQLERAKASHTKAQEEVAREKSHLSDLRSEEEGLRAGRQDLEEEVRRADDSVKAAQARVRLDELEPRIEKFQKALEAAERIERKLSEKARPSQDQLDEISDLRVDLDKKKAALAALGLTIRVHATVAMSVRGPDGTRKLGAGDQIEVQGMSPLSVDLKGCAKVDVQAPQAKGALAAQASIEEAQASLLEQTDRFGTAAPTELKALLKERLQLEGEIARHRDNRQGLFSSDQAYNKAIKEVTDRRAELDAVLSRRPNLQGEIPTPSQAEAHAKSSRRGKEERELRIGAAQSAIATSGKRVEAAESRREACAAEIAKCDVRRTALETTCSNFGGDTPPASRAQALSLLREARTKLENERTAIDLELGPVRNAEGALERAHRELAKFTDLENARRNERSQNVGRLALFRERGLYAEQAQLEEQKAQLDEQLARACSEAEALKLLAALFEEEQKRSVDAVIAPVADKVRRMATAVLRRDARISLDESLNTTGVRIGNDDFSMEQLSAGTQDQFALFTRIAFAELYSESHGRHALILDDPLANSDAKRRRRMLDVIARAAHTLQIVIFTCREEDYLGLDAHKVPLGTGP